MRERRARVIQTGTKRYECLTCDEVMTTKRAAAAHECATCQNCGGTNKSDDDDAAVCADCGGDMQGATQ